MSRKVFGGLNKGISMGHHSEAVTVCTETPPEHQVAARGSGAGRGVILVAEEVWAPREPQAPADGGAALAPQQGRGRLAGALTASAFWVAPSAFDKTKMIAIHTADAGCRHGQHDVRLNPTAILEPTPGPNQSKKSGAGAIRGMRVDQR
jgi:hypothetical protein